MTVPLSKYLQIVQPFMDSVIKFFPHIEADVLKRLDETESDAPKKQSLKEVLAAPTYNSQGVEMSAIAKKDNILTVTRILGFRKSEPIKGFHPSNPQWCMDRGINNAIDVEFETVPDSPPKRMIPTEKTYKDYI